MTTQTSFKKCIHCQQDFSVMNEDQIFYNKIHVPEPTHCPDCRQMRRLSRRNEKHLFKRSCDLCKKEIISAYHENTDFPVFCLTCWWKDIWDPEKFGNEYNFQKPFFEQFAEIQKKVPRMSLLQMKNDNSEYTNCVSHLKDCYFLFSGDFNRNCYYGVWIEKCKNSVDNYIIENCERAYESIFSNNIYNGVYIFFSSQCSDSAFLMDCKGCYNCFMCYGLRNKKYHIMNTAYSKEEYFEKLAQYPYSSYTNLETLKKHFFELIKKAIYLYMRRNGTITDSTGDFLTNVMNCRDCYDVSEAKDCRYIQGAFALKDTYDSSYVNGELGYENIECVPMPFQSCFNVNCYTGSNLLYCDTCMNNCQNCFGCIGLKQSKYCILNKQYTEEEYTSLLPKILDHMKMTGEYGEFFPINISPFAYNESQAQELYPLTKEEALNKEFKWQDIDPKMYQPQTYVIPDDIHDVDQSITKEILACEECNRNYKIIPHEFEFYKQMKLPIPRICFYCRDKKRLALRNPRKLWDRNCMKCGKEMMTTYAPNRPEIVYCEECYLKEVY